MTDRQNEILNRWKLAGDRFAGFQIDKDGKMICCVYDKAITIDKPVGILYRYIYDQDGKLINALPVIYDINEK
jgi:hypothetical protein